MDDHFADYRTFCANRLRRLERYKKAKSFCNVDDERKECSQPSVSNSESLINIRSDQQARLSDPCCNTFADIQKADIAKTRNEYNAHCSNEQILTFDRGQQYFEVLKEKMISLMENDVCLLQKLLALGDSIQELKSKQLVCSQVSMDSLQDNINEDDDRTWSQHTNSPFSPSFSEVTHLYVNDESNNGIQYFSRKNSVLRIPIPPRSSNRMNANRRIPRRPSELVRPVRKQQDFSECIKLETFYDENDLMARPSVYNNTSSRRSNASVDSGIRDISPSSGGTDGSPSSTRRNSPSNTMRNCTPLNVSRECGFCDPILEENRSW